MVNLIAHPTLFDDFSVHPQYWVTLGFLFDNLFAHPRFLIICRRADSGCILHPLLFSQRIVRPALCIVRGPSAGPIAGAEYSNYGAEYKISRAEDRI